MASPINNAPASTPVGPDTLITIKVAMKDTQKKTKLPLSDLTPAVLPGKLCKLLGVPDSLNVRLERYSDSSASYVNLDPENLHAYKTLHRAAKAKLKLRFRAHPSSPSGVAAGGNDIWNDTVNSLANLKFGSESTVNTILAQATTASSSKSAVVPPPVTNSPPAAASVTTVAGPTTTVDPRMVNCLPMMPNEQVVASHVQQQSSRDAAIKASIANILNKQRAFSSTGSIREQIAKISEHEKEKAQMLNMISKQANSNVAASSASKEPFPAPVFAPAPPINQTTATAPLQNPMVMPITQMSPIGTTSPARSISARAPILRRTPPVCSLATGQSIPTTTNTPLCAPTFCPRTKTDEYATFVHLPGGEKPSEEGVSKTTYGWSVYCNNCHKNMLEEHYHCHTCHGGDYDLCLECKDKGVHCPGEDHWLIKRSMSPSGTVISSTTEKVGPSSKTYRLSASVKPTETTKLDEALEAHLQKICKSLSSERRAQTQNDVPKPVVVDAACKMEVKNMPGAFTEENKAVVPPSRTCNSCITVFNEEDFITCLDCDDFDLCVICFSNGKHGHHPAHKFKPVSGSLTLPDNGHLVCQPGRNVAHAAVCDGCSRSIHGVRHKCLICPDWDYCGQCAVDAHLTHPRHRFVPIYEPIANYYAHFWPTHVDVLCDGPLCKGKSKYINGPRYQCTVCPDLDFCGNCEASPLLDHDRNHPLTKYRTAKRECPTFETTFSIPIRVKQDAALAAAAIADVSKISTVADVKPTEPEPKADVSAKTIKEKMNIKDILAEPVPTRLNKNCFSVFDEKIKLTESFNAPEATEGSSKTPNLQAQFVRDTISDGSNFVPGQHFVQVWTLANPGPDAWPAGCSVRYVGGDNMLNVEENKPAPDGDFYAATESNVMRREVQAGEEVCFRVLMKAPSRDGCAISYWRVKAPDGTPFGHRLWCHINVIDPNARQSRSSLSSRDIGRLGTHDSFLRLFLKDQAQKASTLRDERNTLKKVHDAKLDCYIKAHRMFDAPALKRLRNQRLEWALRQYDDRLPSQSHPVEMEAPIPPPPAETVEAKTKSEEKEPTESKVEKIEILVEQKLESSTEKKVMPPSESQETKVSTEVTSPAVLEKTSENTSEIFDDAEDMADMVDSDDESCEFLTDEEYDILDASDEDAIKKGKDVDVDEKK